MIIDLLKDVHDPAELVVNGFGLVQIPPRLKRPIRKGWNHPINIITSLDDIHLLSGMNVGLAHVDCRPHPTCAIDCDDVTQAIKWLEEREVDLVALQNAPDAVGIVSGKPNSSKLIYRLPKNISALPSKAIIGSSGKMMMEFRCATKKGLTVQDVLPPSLHPSGSRYGWFGAGSIFKLPVLPEPLLKIWQELLLQKIGGKNSKSIVIATPDTPRQIANLKHQLSFIDADCDYERYRNVIWGIASTGWHCAYDLALKWSLTAEHRFEEHMLDTLFYSYDPDRDDRITLGTIYHYAKLGGA